jgi:hypothetical protein
VQNDHIVGIANDRWTPIEAMFAVGETAGEVFFQSMQGDIGQQG